MRGSEASACCKPKADSSAEFILSTTKGLRMTWNGIFAIEEPKNLNKCKQESRGVIDRPGFEKTRV
jgi:hypothetical protein